jgi:serine/threonine-protein kinase
LVVGKRVAVKLLHARIGEDSAARMRFVAETRAAARIGHPNVIDIHDLGVTPDGTPYVVMELLEGETLAALVQRRGPMPASEACELSLQILSGLAAAHRKGIIHGDLRPENVIVMRPRSDQVLVKLLDFGASRALPASAELPARARPYLSPEQLSGDAVDERSDVYATAAILHVLVRGTAPARSSVSPKPRDAQGIPKPLAEIIDRALLGKRFDRIGSAEEFAEQLRALLGTLTQNMTSVRKPAHTQMPVVARKVEASKPPDSSVMRVHLAPRLVTDSLLMSPRLPRAPAPPKLEAGKDFLPMLDDPERYGDIEFRSAPTQRADSEQKGLDPKPALLAMAIGFSIGIVIAWVLGLI